LRLGVDDQHEQEGKNERNPFHIYRVLKL
jgi:hypothetical protein